MSCNWKPWFGVVLLLAACSARPGSADAVDKNGTGCFIDTRNPESGCIETGGPGLSSTKVNNNLTCANQTWAGFIEAGPQKWERLERVRQDGFEITPIRFGPLKGAYGKVFLFFRLQGRTCMAAALVVGSYQATNQAMRADGTLAGDERMYHIDLYLPQEHITIGFTKTRPTYEEALELARKHLK